MITFTRGIRLWGAACAAVLVAAGIGTAAFAATPSHAASTLIPKCTASDLGVWVAANQSNGTAGSIYYPMEFTNLSSGTCYLYGHPGVSAVSGTGHQLGKSAQWSAGKSAIVNLAPGATAHAMLQYVVVQLSPSCHPVNAAELSIIPPAQTSSTGAFWDQSSCTTGPVYMAVGVIQPGVGTRNST
jgi:hypothetical protein